jgi:hypothetical protein
MTSDNFCFYLPNRLIQTSQTGGQWYSDTSPFSISCCKYYAKVEESFNKRTSLFWQISNIGDDISLKISNVNLTSLTFAI